VELEKITTPDDKKLLHEMITSHFMHTGSRNAKRILDAWDGMLPKFLKVMPVDYKRVLEERKKKTIAAKT
jgi:glutamate synthase (NADPH) large chain